MLLQDAMEGQKERHRNLCWKWEQNNFHVEEMYHGAVYTRCGSGQSLCESAVESSMGFGHALRFPQRVLRVALRVLAVDFPMRNGQSAPEHCDASCDE